MIVPGTTNACIDIETLATEEDAVLLSVGIALFDPLDDEVKEEDQFYTRIDTAPQYKSGRKVNIDTLQFWRQQDAHTWNEATLLGGCQDSLEFYWFLNGISAIVNGHVWAKDPHFDMVILRNYLGGEKGLPLQGNIGKFFMWRSVRTIIDAAKMVNEPLFSETTGSIHNTQPHHALHDAIHEARIIQSACHVLHEAGRGRVN